MPSVPDLQFAYLLTRDGVGPDSSAEWSFVSDTSYLTIPLAGLNPGTKYTIQISLREQEDPSFVAQPPPFEFTTLSDGVSFDGDLIIEPYAYSARVHFKEENLSDGFVLRFFLRDLTSASDLGGSMPIRTTPYELTGLRPQAIYEIRPEYSLPGSHAKVFSGKSYRFTTRSLTNEDKEKVFDEVRNTSMYRCADPPRYEPNGDLVWENEHFFHTESIHPYAGFFQDVYADLEVFVGSSLMRFFPDTYCGGVMGTPVSVFTGTIGKGENTILLRYRERHTKNGVEYNIQYLRFNPNGQLHRRR